VTGGKTLEQRWWLERRTFRLGEDGVQVTTRQFMNDQQFKVPFENVPDDRIVTTRRHPIWIILTMVLLSMTVLGVVLNLEKDQPSEAAEMGAIFGALTAVCAAAFFLTRQRLVAFATGDSSLVFFASSPSEEAVASFLAAIVEARDAYLRARYQGPVPGESPLDALERLGALRERGVISEEEFDSLKARIVSPGTTPPGDDRGGTYI
jgi:hypothetical protein